MGLWELMTTLQSLVGKELINILKYRFSGDCVVLKQRERSYCKRISTPASGCMPLSNQILDSAGCNVTALSLVLLQREISDVHGNISKDIHQHAN